MKRTAQYSVGEPDHPQDSDDDFHDLSAAEQVASAASFRWGLAAVFDNHSGEVLVIYYNGHAYRRA